MEGSKERTHIYRSRAFKAVITTADVPDETVHLVVEAPLAIEVMGGLFSRFEALRTVDLRGCPKIRFFSPILFSEAPNLKTILIGENRRRCLPKLSFNEAIRGKIKYSI